MSRLPEPKLKEITAPEEYEGIKKDRDNFLCKLANLIKDVDLKGVS